MKPPALRTIDGPPTVLFVQLIRCRPGGESEETLVDVPVCVADEVSARSLCATLALVAADAVRTYADVVEGDAEALNGARDKQSGPQTKVRPASRKAKASGRSLSSAAGARKAAAAREK